ncbi:alpha/beta hydrolase [Glycomyces buryatensis]|uniref:Alpha/beta hydrolase n=1 Tax=Glycomyces buryatensis TaxID=2570927 RepID=A0A4V4HSJ8_9ACTN|nr:alpha/beta fold hydrolase [Glycomyces buryatensis]THV41986.1 alpha/beta hydrolase [Glycomyces buryatensis]
MPWAGLLRLSIIVLIVGALVVLAAWIWQRALIYYPDTSTPPVPSGATEVTLHTADGLDLTAWEFAPGTSLDRESAVLVAPGNAGNRSGRAQLGTALAAEGFTVLLLEYRGYGGNPGFPSQDGLYADARAAWDHLRERFEADRILLFGESIGAGVATGLSTEVDPAGLVLRSPFTSLADAGQEHYPLLPVKLMLRDRYPIVDDLASNGAPVTVIYSENDEIIPASQSKAVAEAAEAAGVLTMVVAVEAYGHNDPTLTGGRQVVDGVTALADELGLSAAPR